jgi:hypothetical protein
MLGLSQCRVQLLRAVSPIDGRKLEGQRLIGSVGAVLGTGPWVAHATTPVKTTLASTPLFRTWPSYSVKTVIKSDRESIVDLKRSLAAAG